MTTSPVMGITEEILGEIERAGWKLVPVEPTPEMVERSQYWHRCREPQVPPENFRGFYDALLAAAPAAPATQQPVQTVPDYRVYAVIDSMGWDLDGQERDDMYRLCRAMLATAQEGQSHE